MNEAPKKVWIHEGFWDSGDSSYWTRDGKESEEETQYIRADIVDELVEALKYCLQFNGHAFMYDDTKAEAALKKLEEK
jgi:hypothetical protein